MRLLRVTLALAGVLSLSTHAHADGITFITSLYTDFGLDIGGLVVNSYVPGTGFSEIIVDGSTPEPSTFALLGTGVLAMAGMVRHRLGTV